ncbi:MAG: glycosyltransferase family 4 protein [Pseudohaliea sp.]
MKILLFANTDWYLYNFRLSLAHSLRARGHAVVLVSPDGLYGKRLRDLGFRWIAAPLDRRSLNLLREARLVHWLGSLLRDEKVDLVHGFTIKCAVYAAVAARLAGDVAYVGAVAGLGYVFTSASLRARMLRPLLRGLMRATLGGRAGRVVLQNPDDVALFVRERLVTGEQLRLIPSSGVDCGTFSPLPGGQSGDAAFRVLLPARLLWDKGVGDLIDAARKLRAMGRLAAPQETGEADAAPSARPVRILLAGDPDPGNPAAVPEETLRNWQETGLVQWLGHVEKMRDCLRSADAVVLPSYREGLPRGLIEAGACGRPLITTDAPGCREVVTHEREGLLVPVRDAGALASAMLRLADDPALCERLGAAAREKVLQEFDERIVIERTFAVYRELLPGF